MSGRASRLVRAATLLYGGLGVLLPRRFREAFWRDAVAMFADRAAAVRADRGRWSVLVLFVRAACDVLVQAAGVRLDLRREAELAGPSRGRERAARAFHGLGMEFRQAVRQLVRAPGFAVTVLATVAVAVGASGAMFGVIEGVLLRPLPLRDPETLVSVWERNQERGWPRFAVSPANYFDWSARSRTLAGLAAYTTGNATLTEGGEPARIQTLLARVELFDVLGAGPSLGRGFAAGEDEAGADDVAILSHRLWTTRFGGDRSLLGRTVRVDDRPLRVIGVLPPDFGFRPEADLWLPLVIGADVAQHRAARYLSVIGRRSAAQPLARVQAELDGIAASLAREHAASNAGWDAVAVPLHDEAVSGVKRALLVLFGSVGFVLLIAFANVLNLVLAKDSARRDEFGVRRALGAAPARILRQLLVESGLLAVTGAIAGVALAAGFTRLLLRFEPGILPRVENVRTGLPVMFFCALVAVLLGLAVGLVSAFRVTRAGHAGPRESGFRIAGRSGHTLRRGLLVAEIALAVVLLAGWGLLTRSLLGLLDVDPGFQPAGLVTAAMSPPAARYPEPRQSAAFFEAVSANLRAVPFVRDVSITNRLPLRGSLPMGFATIDGSGPPQTEWPTAEFRAVDPAFFRTLGIPLLRGRPLAGTDREGAPPVAIINEALARRFFPGRDPIGQRIDVDGMFDRCPCEIVGLVGDVMELGLDQAAAPVFYLPQSQSTWPVRMLVVRSDAPLESVILALREAVAAVDPDVALYDIATLESDVAFALATPRFNVLLMGLFAALALLLAAIGVYGTTSYVVNLQTRELGVRAALGARRGRIVWLVQREVLALSAAGAAIGLLAAVALTRLMRGLLFGAQSLDTNLLLAIAAFIAAVGAAAALPPALRAGRADPLRSLQSD